jgi:hypothetical protein
MRAHASVIQKKKEPPTEEQPSILWVYWGLCPGFAVWVKLLLKRPWQYVGVGLLL